MAYGVDPTDGHPGWLSCRPGIELPYIARLGPARRRNYEVTMTSRTFAFGVGSLGVFLMLCTGAAAVAADSPIVSSSKDVKWGPAPPILPKGAMMTVMAGDPGVAGLVAVRLKMPAGYKIPAHWHPTDEQVTVISGTVAL